MYKPISPFLLLPVATILFACKWHTQNQATTNMGDGIFSSNANDSLIFTQQTSTEPATIGSDSAYKTSDLVITCTVLAIDSTVHQNEKAPFYLVGVKTDTLLKGNAKKGGQLYFVSKYLPDLVPGQGNRILYLCKRKTAKLLAYNHIGWQWVDNAPFIAYDKTKIFEQAVPKK